MFCLPALAIHFQRALAWEGDVTADDRSKANYLLSTSGYEIEAKVITPYAERAEQMFTLIRAKEVDLSFLTLFFVNLQQGKPARFLQTIKPNFFLKARLFRLTTCILMICCPSYPATLSRRLASPPNDDRSMCRIGS